MIWWAWIVFMRLGERPLVTELSFRNSAKRHRAEVSEILQNGLVA